MTRVHFQLIADVLAKHNASEDMVRAFAEELAETNPRFNRQRFMDAAMPLKRTVYVASAWWHDCDPFVTVVGNDAKKVERAIYRAVRNAAVDAHNQSEPEDKRKVRDYMDDIGWSGVNTFAFDAIIPDSITCQYEADQVFHHPDMDYSDYELLRNGERDAIVYL